MRLLAIWVRYVVAEPQGRFGWGARVPNELAGSRFPGYPLKQSARLPWAQRPLLGVGLDHDSTLPLKFSAVQQHGRHVAPANAGLVTELQRIRRCLEANVQHHVHYFSKSLVDFILGLARAHGHQLSLSHGRDLTARVLVDRPYSPAMAAARAGAPPHVLIDAERTARLCDELPNDAPAIQALMAIAEHHLFWVDDHLRLVMPVSKAISQGRLAAPSEATWSMVESLLAQHKLTAANLDAVAVLPATLHRGPHLSFLRRSGWWYLVEDALVEDARGNLSGSQSVVIDGAMLFVRARGMDHHAAAWVFDRGQWSLQWRLHRIANDSDLHLTYEQLANGG